MKVQILSFFLFAMLHGFLSRSFAFLEKQDDVMPILYFQVPLMIIIGDYNDDDGDDASETDEVMLDGGIWDHIMFVQTCFENYYYGSD